jgi:hypothetical protein
LTCKVRSVHFSPACQIDCYPILTYCGVGSSRRRRSRRDLVFAEGSAVRRLIDRRAQCLSTIVGAPLNTKQMRTVSFFCFSRFFTYHFFCAGLLDYWSHGNDGVTAELSHGRPTMRHLSDVGAVERRGIVDWATFVS